MIDCSANYRGNGPKRCRNMTSVYIRICALVFLCSLAGCGSGVKDRLYKVSGTVKFADGQPLTAGMINFDSGKYNAFGAIESDGSFTLTTLNPGDGAPAGEYRVYLTPGGGSPPPFHLKHLSAATSGITQEVKKQANKVEITVERYVAPPEKKKAN